MAGAYITEKQVGREFCYFSVWNAEMMLDQVPGCLELKLSTPFELVHNIKNRLQNLVQVILYWLF